MSLIEFYKILSNEHKEYEKLYRDLLEVGWLWEKYYFMWIIMLLNAETQLETTTKTK